MSVTPLKHIFLSYSRQDTEVVNRLADALHAQGFSVWIDQHDLIPGTLDWEDTIRSAIAGAQALVLVASPHSRRSRYVRDEISIAEMHHCAIIPFWIDGEHWIDCVPLGMGRAQNIDARAALFEAAVEELADVLGGSGLKRTTDEHAQARQTVFLTYCYGVEPDQTLALAIEAALITRGFDVLVDDTAIPMGTRGAERVRGMIDKAQHFIALLSAESVQNEVMRAEIVYATEHTGHSPHLLPVRVGLRSTFPYHLRQYLDPVPWAFWRDEGDTRRIVDEICAALGGSTLGLVTVEDKARVLMPPVGADRPRPHADPTQIIQEVEHATGTVDPQSHFYIERPSDSELREALQKADGRTILIKAPRQMGKSSLLIRGRQMAQELGQRVVFLDFQMLSNPIMQDEKRLFQWFTRQCARALALPDLPDVDEVWDDFSSSGSLCTEYFEEYILYELGDTPLVLAIDEIDRLFGTPFRSDFFGMLRAWHNNRSYNDLWRHFSMIMVISTEPYMLIDNLDQSPFNVGRELTLTDFTLTQLAELNARHNYLLDERQQQRLHTLVNGHPYLTREAFYQIAAGHMTFDELLATVTDDRSPFSDHLMHYLFLLSTDSALERDLAQVVTGTTRIHDQQASRLLSAGLVRREGDNIVPRCELYALYFQKRLMS